MPRPDTAEHSSKDQTKNWFLDSFRAAKSGPSSFEFPELDNDLDNSLRTDDSKLSEDILFDPGLGGFMSRLSTEEISDTSLNPESPRPRRSRARLLEALETPRETSVNEYHKESPSSSRHIDISRLFEYFAVSPTTLQPQAAKGSPHTEPPSSDDDLTDEDWDYLSQICSFLDDQETEAITRSSSFNTQDGRDAASALGLDEPSGKRLHIFLELGLSLYKYSDQAKPWTAALAAKEQRAFSHKHHIFLTQRREANLIKAAQIHKDSVLSDFFAHFKAALYNYRQGPQQLLHFYELLRLRPIYYREWRSQIQHCVRLDAKSETIATKARIRRSFRKLRLSINRVNQQSALSKRIFEDTRCRQILGLWRQRKTVMCDTLNVGAANAKVTMFRRYVSIWMNNFRLLRARKILLKIEFGKLSMVLQSRREEKKLAIDLELKRILLYWKQQTFEFYSSYSKQSKCEMMVGNRVKDAIFKVWHTKLKEIAVSYTIKQIIAAKYLKEMRLKMALSRYLRRKKQALKRQYLTNWNRNYVGISNLQLCCRQLQLHEDYAIKHLTWHLMQKEFRQLRIETRRKVVHCRRFVLGITILRILRHSRSANLSKTALSRALRNRTLSARFLKSLADSSEAMKSMRLAIDSAEYKRRLDVNNLLLLLRHWRVKAQASVHLINQVYISSHKCCQQNIFQEWREATNRAISTYEGASNLRCKLLSENALASWKELAGLYEDFVELANSYNTSKLASIFKVKLRRWQQQGSSVLLAQSQANRLREGRIRSIALSVLQDWQEHVKMSDQKSVPFDSSILLYPSPWRGAPNLHQVTPGKRPPMSPNRLQKWKNQNRAFSSNRPRQNDRSRVLPISHSSSLAEEKSLVTQRSNAGTPTRPHRAVINSDTTSSSRSLI